MNRVTFKLRNTGIKGVKGLAYIEEGFLVLKLRIAIMGLIGRDRETIKIEPQVLESVSIKRGPRRHNLVLKPKGVEFLDAIPGNHISSVTLRVKRKQRKVLKALVEEIQHLRV